MPDAQNKKILLVEDDQFLSSLLKNRLEKESLLVVVADDGQKALDILKKEKPDVVLLDLILPGISGFDVLEKIRAESTTKALPVIIISNLGQEEDRKKVAALGVADYFVKAETPIDILVEKVKLYLANPGSYASTASTDEPPKRLA